ncbi:MAG: sigma-E processing peptidase SpoIIGA [Clostridia bacterium]|nr:sigma-E processing peptidase SpoIIGA [Clostridia bacterium]
MTEYIYGDILFVIDFSMDFLSLFLVGKLLHRKMKTWRMTAAAAVGGVYGVCSLLFDIGALPNIMLDFAVAVAVCFIAFGYFGIGRLSVSVALFYGVSMLIGGVMTAVFVKIGAIYDATQMPSAMNGIPLWYFAVAAVASVIISDVLSRIMKRKNEHTVSVVCVTVCGKSAILSAMTDSGNVLREPISDIPVVFIGRSAASFISRELTELMSDCSLLTSDGVLHGLHIIPCSTVGGRSLIAVLRPDKLTVDGVPRRAFLAIGDNESFDGYDALVPSELTGG